MALVQVLSGTFVVVVIVCALVTKWAIAFSYDLEALKRFGRQQTSAAKLPPERRIEQISHTQQMSRAQQIMNEALLRQAIGAQNVYGREQSLLDRIEAAEERVRRSRP